MLPLECLHRSAKLHLVFRSLSALLWLVHEYRIVHHQSRSHSSTHYLILNRHEYGSTVSIGCEIAIDPLSEVGSPGKS